MNEQQGGQPEPIQPDTPPADAGTSLSQQEISEGKVFAILCYALSLIGLPFFLVPLIMRNNEFALYHAKQTLMIWLGGIVISAVGSVLLVVCIGIVILLAGFIFLLVLDVMGLINAVNERMQPLPLIGKWGEDWFRGITKVG